MDPSLIDAPYRNASLPIHERVADLLGRMTLDEKVAQLAGTYPRTFMDGDAFSETMAQQAMPDGISQFSYVAGITALPPRELAIADQRQRSAFWSRRRGSASRPSRTVRAAAATPDTAARSSRRRSASRRRGIPRSIEEAATVMREQMRAVGIRHTLSPVLDIVRDARWGRCEETYGEDPYLAGRSASATCAASRATTWRTASSRRVNTFLATAHRKAA